MGERQWLENLESGQDQLRVHFYTEQGEVVTIALVQYEALIDDEWRAIVRFDEAHGFFHRDIMSPTGLLEKAPMPESNKKLALSQAIDHLKRFWPIYRKRYEEQYYDKRA